VAVALGAVVTLGGHLLVLAGAVLAAGATALLVHRVAAASGRVVVATMLLAGLALSALLAALTAVVLAAGGAAEMRTVAFWTLGSFSGVVGLDVLIGLLVLPCVIVIARLGPRLDAMALGRTEAGHLGVDVVGLTRWSTVVLALLVGVAVAIGGVVAFLALLVPSLVRAWIGPTHRWLTVGAALLGATLLVLADVVARNLFAPVELPVGVITTLVGAPFFLWLLLRQRGWLAR
jgi:iron complex transport system permease protein